MNTKELQAYRNQLNADLDKADSLTLEHERVERWLAVRTFLLTTVLIAVERELQISKIVDLCLTGK